jgi:hypothetical protein
MFKTYDEKSYKILSNFFIEIWIKSKLKIWEKLAHTLESKNWWKWFCNIYIPKVEKILNFEYFLN